MRAENSIKNAFIAVIMNLITIVIGFVAQKVFINTLGIEYLGINGLFTNILSMLAIVELGLGSAIIYHLYQPVAQQNKTKIQSLLLFYKISYRAIAVIVTLIGLLIIPFLGSIVGQVSIQENIIAIYLLFLIDIVASYLLSYKRSILYAHQKMYITNIVHIFYLIILNFVQILALLLTQNYILYLILKIVCRIIENIVITIIANKRYPYIQEKNSEKIDSATKKDIFTKVKGLIYHKVSGFIVLGTDNIIIAKFLGIATVGFYSNYSLIIQAANNLFSQVFNSITASVGNLLIQKEKEKSYQVYHNMLFLNSWIFCVASTGILCVIEPFMKVWLGAQFILPFGVLIAIVVNFYIQGMRKTCNTFKEAAGIFYEDRFIPIWESIINIIASITFVLLFGLAGVFIGTILSTFILFFYSYPKYVYKPLFERTYRQYLKDYIPYILVSFLSVILTYFITSSILISNNLGQIFINLIFVLTIPNIIHLFCFRKTEEFEYYKYILLKLKNNSLAKKGKE